MSEGPRRARVRALAKVNLSLKVLDRRPDGYHELRTVFQTISLADTLEITFTPARRTSIAVHGTPEIPDNLAGRAAGLVMDAMGKTGRVEVTLTKHIPVGAGLGGGSSDAAAVLLALPVLAGKDLGLETLAELAAQLGSDVPFFLLGGRVLGLGRGTELYPLPDQRIGEGVVVAPGLHISTQAAYRALARPLTSRRLENKINSFRSWLWSQDEGASELSKPAAENDFEPVVFARYPRLKLLKRQLEGSGARAAMLSGSGSALFGIYSSRSQAERACRRLGNVEAFRVSFVSRARYRSLWRRWLRPHMLGRTWPPRSRYRE